VSWKNHQNEANFTDKQKDMLQKWDKKNGGAKVAKGKGEEMRGDTAAGINMDTDTAMVVDAPVATAPSTAMAHMAMAM